MYIETYPHGISLMGIKKPLVNPAIAASIELIRSALRGNVRMSQIVSATQTWLRATFTNAI